MNNLTYSNALKEIRSYSKNLGLTFKKQNMTINNTQAYKFTDRLTGETVGENFTLWSAYDNMQNGYLDTLKR